MKSTFVGLLEHVDPAKIEKYWPGPDKYIEFKKLKEALQRILQKVNDRKPLSPDLLKEMDELSTEFRNLGESLHSSTEIASKSAVNQIYHWVSAGHVERSIYLAGVSKGRKLAEPYYTQIQLLPANACLFRYLQVYPMAAAVNDLAGDRADWMKATLSQMLSSLLQQFEYFAVQANKTKQIHPMATYMLALSKIYKASAVAGQGDDEDQKEVNDLLVEANDLIERLEEPTEGIHYMHAQYHVMNCDEFEGLSVSVHLPKIADRLRFLRARARELQKEQKTFVPKEYYEITPYLVLGGRASSVAGLVGTFGYFAGVDPAHVDAAIRELWHTAVNLVPGLEAEGTNIALHGGGPAREFATVAFAHGGGPALHAGGMA